MLRFIKFSECRPIYPWQNIKGKLSWERERERERERGDKVSVNHLGSSVDFRALRDMSEWSTTSGPTSSSSCTWTRRAPTITAPWSCTCLTSYSSTCTISSRLIELWVSSTRRTPRRENLRVWESTSSIWSTRWRRRSVFLCPPLTFLLMLLIIRISVIFS